MTPDDNDIVYSQYSPDLLGIVRAIAEVFTGSDVTANDFVNNVLRLWDVWTVIAFLLSISFIVGIIYAYIRIGQLSEEEVNRILDAEKRWREKHNARPENKRWSNVQEHLKAPTENDWKAAIVEADILLGEVLAGAGHGGLTIGEQLNGAATQNYRSIQDAWDAHKIRNRIAHEGSDFHLTQMQAKEAIIKYQRVFEEFGAI